MLPHNTDNTVEEVFVETSTPNRQPILKKKKKQPDKISLIWKHVTHVIDLNVTKCNYCNQSWNNLRGSTSNSRHHLRAKYWGCLSPKE